MLNRTLRLPGGMSACIVIHETPADNMKLTTTVIRRTILISPRFFRQDSSMQVNGRYGGPASRGALLTALYGAMSSSNCWLAITTQPPDDKSVSLRGVDDL